MGLAPGMIPSGGSHDQKLPEKLARRPQVKLKQMRKARTNHFAMLFVLDG
jgi:hypothetical protein